ncbi:hypothetical protein GON26_08275 [Flavobacterium sp. GA093]|uniref:Uncharacterized protein n=1 Tax=Flavobacterium hydrocarbonoxydans TaxID=2683249 RepID=A0A6I4NIP0_9FLAO|nr:hypothetical protein [Flavobacterium hydrocarbonoxydans]MWB94356.1 hypothetical protein [Flavobacterium hydrocarbonoxydans]
MRKPFLTILIFLFGIQILIGQNNNDPSNDWDKILITDAYGGWSNFDNKFQIKKQDLLLTSLEKPDSIIKRIDPKLVSELVKSIRNTNDYATFKNPLISFGRDSLWLINNAENLWKEYTKGRKTTKEIDAIAINTIKDYKKANHAASSLEGSHSTDDYPVIIVSIINEKDTLSAYSFGQYPYMLPWNTKKRRIYDSKISELVAQLLPDKLPNNKERLSGINFNTSFVKEIYSTFLADKENFLEARNAFPGTFRSLKKEFEISKAEIVDMSSIEWGGLVGRRCLEMLLKDSTISKNIQFYTISGVNELLTTKRSIIRRKKDLINLLNENPIYKYTLNCGNCLGEIHWVKSKSLSTEAKNEFKEDLEENGIDKKKYNGRYKDAIFFELTENRESERSFSRWIFLKDGTLILWQLRGNYLMNFPKDFFANQGYICKEVML